MTVASWPCPRDLHELRSYVGWAFYQGHFISGFADIVCPIHQLTAKGQPIEWKDIRSLFEESRVLCSQFKFSRIRDDVSVCQFHRGDSFTSHKQIVVPEGNFATAHLSVRNTQAHIQQREYWPAWRTDAEIFWCRCSVFQTVQHGVAPRYRNMQTCEAIVAK